MPPVGPPAPGDRYKYEQKQVRGADDYVISEKRKSQNDDTWQITVRKYNGPSDAPIPGIEIEGWQQEEIEATSPNERRFQYLRYGEVMTEEDAGTNLTRTVVFRNPVNPNEQDAPLEKRKAALDILSKENTWPEIRITRNETLFGDVACVEGSSLRTNPSFVYHTPWVRFAEILKPRLEYGRAIDIAKLAAKLPENLETVVPPSLKDHLSRLFKRFFESAGEDGVKRRMQLTCRYQYDLNKPANENDLLVITLPIVMAPPFDFTIPDGKNETGSFPQSLSDSIKNWLDDRHPSGKSGRFVFDISVYSSLGTAKLPVYRVSNLQLRLEDIKPEPKEARVFHSKT